MSYTHLKAINQKIHNQAKATWEKLEDGRAGDQNTFDEISNMEITRYYTNFPSSLTIYREEEPPPYLLQNRHYSG